MCAGHLGRSRGIPGCGLRLFAHSWRCHPMGGGGVSRLFRAWTPATPRGESRLRMERRRQRCRRMTSSTISHGGENSGASSERGSARGAVGDRRSRKVRSRIDRQRPSRHPSPARAWRRPDRGGGGRATPARGSRSAVQGGSRSTGARSRRAPAPTGGTATTAVTVPGPRPGPDPYRPRSAQHIEPIANFTGGGIGNGIRDAGSLCCNGGCRPRAIRHASGAAHRASSQ